MFMFSVIPLLISIPRASAHSVTRETLWVVWVV
ncbi:hypothetical protein M758_7G034900 [Ceratodon purpureus]|nr:hypothetical protein M758_7G034900 [Ceratodon purpureus]